MMPRGRPKGSFKLKKKGKGKNKNHWYKRPNRGVHIITLTKNEYTKMKKKRETLKQKINRVCDANAALANENVMLVHDCEMIIDNNENDNDNTNDIYSPTSVIMPKSTVSEFEITANDMIHRIFQMGMHLLNVNIE